MIAPITLSRLYNAEYLQIMTDLLAIAGSASPNTIQAARTALAAKVTRMDEVFKTDTASPLTANLEAKDKTRDGLVTGLALLCDALTYHPDAAKREAAGLLAHNLDIYGESIAAQSYNAESASITNMINDWKNTITLDNAASLLDLGEWRTALENANNDFKTTYTARTTAMAAQQTPDTMKSLRAETTPLWYKLRDKVDGYYQVTDGTAPWGTMVSQMNALIEQYNALLDSRKGGAGPGTPPPPAPGGGGGAGD